jgi:hypothetical protein
LAKLESFLRISIKLSDPQPDEDETVKVESWLKTVLAIKSRKNSVDIFICSTVI